LRYIPKVALSVLLLVGLVSASLPISGNNSWESTIGGQLVSIFGSGTYCFGGIGDENCTGGNSIEVGSIIMSVFILGFIFIWSSVSGIGWDGIFFMMMIVLVLLGQGQSGLLGLPAWGLFNFIFSIIVLGMLYREILRRG
jgi:hypothetical protein